MSSTRASCVSPRSTASRLSTQITIPTTKDDPLAAGTHKLKYWAQDINGNVEAQHVVTFTVVEDTAKPGRRLPRARPTAAGTRPA